MWTWLLSCALAADGDLWLKIEEMSGGDRVLFNLPVSDLREPGERAVLHTTAGEVDLRAEARRLPLGEERHFATTTGEKLTLSHVAAHGAAATTLRSASAARPEPSRPPPRSCSPASRT